jgi:hypothetical protein
MRTLKALSTLALTIVVLAFPTTGKAAELGNKTLIAFTQPVAIPGMVLAPGAYIFKTSNLSSQIVQIYDATETHLLATEMTVPSYRLDTSAKTVATFDERAAGSAQALRSFYAADQTAGREFIYDAEAGQ